MAIAASTHEGEEEQVLDAHREVLGQIPEALLVLVPRHPERFDRVAALVERRGFALARRSAEQSCSEKVSVLLGDTMGELPVFLAAGNTAFIGGSLVPHGGHNVLEPAALAQQRALGKDAWLAPTHPPFSGSLAVESDPPGARVFARPYGHDEIPWDDLGTTPIDTLAYVAGVIELKLELEGYRETEDVIWNRYFQRIMALARA